MMVKTELIVWEPAQLRYCDTDHIMQRFICDQQDCVVCSEFYGKPVEGCEDTSDVGLTADCFWLLKAL